MTQLEQARRGNVTPEMELVARVEGMDVAVVLARVADGSLVIPANRQHSNLIAMGVGKGTSVKINANIGTSPLRVDLDIERRKLKEALRGGADAVMDLSTGGDIDAIRAEILAECPVPLGTVPLYQVAKEAGDKKAMTMALYMDVLRRQAEQGVDFITIHAGITRRVVPHLERRLMKSVSRGGAILLAWMRHHDKDNFLYEGFDEVLALAKQYDMTLSLGDGMRPGCLHDATDGAQLEELRTLGELQQRAVEAGVQVMIEGPGHIPYNEIQKNIELEKDICHNAPFYVLGPLPTDIAAGYDHIACAIGGALAAYCGADFLCYVTPKEHIGLPDPDDVYQGVIVTKLAAHIADVGRGNPRAVARNLAMAKARHAVDWIGMQNHSLDPENFARIRRDECNRNPNLVDDKFCSMCGDFCVFEQKLDS